ncbi:BamA/TamA family outer membrane protein [Solitalea lacus]|uniref:translocation and assembly module lipoprotein TamL n=1 Tax=Solitalea lacus TaxID=2911172 RepID=UPI001EDC1635|nr:BamA/TamA family outer membrane protein [Solitalea lacus]UKJ06461.1 BamA/TamA family outer membrane protein [Solitalea lacus]
MKSFIPENFNKTIFIFLISLTLGSCNPSRYLKQNESLIDKVEIKGVEKDLTEDAKSFVPNPNAKILGQKFALGLYNTFNTKKGQYKTKTKKIGEPPAIFDSAQAFSAVKKMSRFLLNKGYFNNTVKLKIDTLGKKKIRLTYEAKQGPVYKVRNYKFNIPDTALNKLYTKEYKTPIDSGKNYDYYLLEREASRANNTFKQNGYKDFEKSYVRFRLDTLFNDSIRASTSKNVHSVDIITIINNPKGEDHHQVYTMNNTFVTITPGIKRREVEADTIRSREDLYFLDKEGRYKPRHFSNLIFFKKGTLYNNDDFLKTYTRLGDLNLFKFINADFKKVPGDSTKLDTYIELIPAKKRTATLEGEFTLSGSYLGTNAGVTYMNKNFFGGGEIFEFKLKGGLEFQPDNFNGVPQPNIRSKTVETSASVLFPRLLAPFNVNISKYSLPKTRISLGYSYEDRQQYFKSGNTNTNISYEWRENLQKSHYLTPLSVSLVNANLNDSLEKAYIRAGNIAAVERYDSYFSLGSQYTYLFNDFRLRFGGNFIYFKGNFDIAGNTLYLGYKIAGASKDTTGRYNTFGRPFYQYVKPDAEIRYYKSINKRQIVTRFNLGVGIAYLNSSSMPYQKLYGSGGANSLRAWRARQVGPGAFPRNDIIPQNAYDTVLVSQEQLGEMKLEANLEYRFNITTNFFGFKLNGATFIDAGNVWNVKKDLDFLYPQGQFKFNSFYKELAIGTGLGVRLDLTFMIIRFDAGLKLHDPQFQNDRWVIKNWFNKDFKNQYPSFRFINYNIGIGYPF